MTAEPRSSLQERVALLRAQPDFQALTDDEVAGVAACLRDEHGEAGHRIIAEGEAGDTLYLLAAGAALVTVAGQKDPVPLATLGPGELFGELALLEDQGKRQASVTLTAPSHLLALSRADFDALLDRNPALRAHLNRQRDIGLRTKFLKLATPFAALDPAVLRRLAEGLGRRRCEAGEVIVRQGEPGDEAYLVESGKVEVLLDEGGETRSLATLGRGALMGEAALLTQASRNATLRAAEATELLVLRREDLLQVAVENRPLVEAMAWLLQSRDRPRRREGVQAFHRTTPEGETITVLKDPSRYAYYRLSPQGWFVWQLLDGQHTPRLITLAYLSTFKTLAPDAVAAIITGLADAGFIETQRLALAPAAEGSRGRLARVGLAARRLLEAQLSFRGLDPWLERLHRGGLRHLFTRPAQAGLALIALLGLAAFFLVTERATAALAAPGGAALLWLLLPAQFVSIVLHEAGHACTAKAFGREVPRAGIGWYWFGPIAFVDTSDLWLSGRWPRLAVTLAGPYMNVLTAGAACIAAWFVQEPTLVAFLWQFALVSYIAVLINLNPLMEYDGYFILADALDRPNLRAKALARLGKSFPGGFLSRQSWREHRLELTFGVGAVLYLFVMGGVMLAIYRLVLEGWIAGLLPSPLPTLLAWTMALGVIGLCFSAVAGQILAGRRS